MSAEQSGGLDMIERRDISLEDLDLLSQAVSGSPVVEVDDAKDPVTDFLETFATPPQLAAFEKAKQGSIGQNTKEATMWPRFRSGILWHPAIIGKLTALLGVESLDNDGEAAWKNEGNCKEDIRFVSPGAHRTIEETRELMAVCEDCPVLADCHEYVINNSLQYGFWAGVARSKGTGYHDDKTPVTLEEQRARMDFKRR